MDKEKNYINEEIDDSVGTMEDVNAVMKKYDRESNVRIYEGVPRILVRALMVGFAFYALVDAVFLTTLPERRYSIFLGLIVLMGYLTFPVKKGVEKVNHIPWYDYVLMILGSGSFFFYAINAMTVIRLSARVMQSPLYMAVGLIAIITLVELCRRCVGLPILFVAGALLLYTFASGLSLQRVIRTLFFTTNGIFSSPVQVCVKYIVLFIIFGYFLERTGVADFFIKFANCAVGRFTGGPAKVAVVASALEGMASGSSVANTVGSGSITIPMMKKMGYRPEFAAAVEAAASTGGQIMPPIMGAAAFLMAEFTGEPYSSIAMRAIIPAILYFTGIFIAVHLEAKRVGMKGIPKEQLPKVKELLKQIYLLLPLIVLVYLVSSNTYTMAYSAAISIGVAVVVGILNKNERLTLTRFFDALEGGAKGSITVVVACSIAGIISGCITVTGLASKLLAAIVALSSGEVLIALLLTMICCIVLGMGVPTTANYCIMAATCAPILMDPSIGVTKLAAHFFVFYFGIVADITPPVALAAYAGAAIAKSNPMKTGLTATKLAIAAFIVPFVFALNPAMLLINVSGALEVVQIVITALIGLFAIAAALNGFLWRHIPFILRIAIAFGGLMMVYPGTVSDLLGFLIVLGIVLFQLLTSKGKSMQGGVA